MNTRPKTTWIILDDNATAYLDLLGKKDNLVNSIVCHS